MQRKKDSISACDEQPIESMGYLVNRCARVLTQTLARALAPLDLAVAQFMVLQQLWVAEDLTQRDLVERLDIEQATMGNTLGRMERDGLITRRPHPTDGRAQIIVPSERAMRLKDQALEAAASVNDLASSQLSMTRQKQLKAMLEGIILEVRKADAL
ncbi:MarR family winged helix-turn-helix transcriptional regulator [Gluconacetobacter sacchari]|uniref:MarR family transcriptional regulator n=2 Tax=Gluconacetobacter sacchari TaxID=92759 RepID=A0A7W4NQU6_9PROT|nr:MarR family transcriptional regulator [Gluconacetobacter sacchari]MBB2162747.1 MarR family transcriptional regulator [Gluconacetobacter sacchari]GBQ29900.1 MarR family transcriptional regulator [Gluconacetobacter sacchari DSM 12717]